MKQAEAYRIHEEALSLARRATVCPRCREWGMGLLRVCMGQDYPCYPIIARQLKKAGVVDYKAWNGGYDI